MKIFLAQLIKGDSLPNHSGGHDLTSILNIVFVAAGALAFLMVVIGGFRYILADGNSDSVSAAKRTIIYALVGIVVIGIAASIVNVVLNGL